MKTTKKRRPWTTQDVRDLRAFARLKNPAGKIARKLRRSESATRQKAFSIKLSLKSAGRTRHTPAMRRAA